MPLRFPGQYFDKETNLSYNVMRDYDAQIARYVESDPIGVKGGLNTYVYALANSLTKFDPLGLAVWICNREVQGFPRVGNHGYLWNDKTRKSCGMQGSFGMGPIGEGEPGYPTHACNEVPGSAGKEEEIMNCCRKNANNWLWFPRVNDCHNAANDCIEEAGLRNPGAPGGRFSECSSCQPQVRDLFFGAP